MVSVSTTEATLRNRRLECHFGRALNALCEVWIQPRFFSFQEETYQGQKRLNLRKNCAKMDPKEIPRFKVYHYLQNSLKSLDFDIIILCTNI